jgi:hypothetical protein
MIVYADPRTCVKCERTMPSECFAINRRTETKLWRKRKCRQCVNAENPWTPERKAAWKRALRRRQRTAEGREAVRRVKRESRARRLRIDPTARERARAASARYYAKKTPEEKAADHARVAEYKRAVRRRRREEAMIRVRVEPLLGYLDLHVKEAGSVVALAKAAGMDDSMLGSWLDGGRKTARLDTVDRLLVNLGDQDLLAHFYDLEKVLATARKRGGDVGG